MAGQDRGGRRDTPRRGGGHGRSERSERGGAGRGGFDRGSRGSDRDRGAERGDRPRRGGYAERGDRPERGDRRSWDERPERGDRPHRNRDAGHRGARARTASTPAQRSKTTDPARNAAFDVLRAVEGSDSYANLVLPPLLRKRGIRGRDAGFATELAYGTLRMRGLYDAILAKCTDRPLTDLDAPVLDVLRLGAHQVLGMRVKEHAAVSETVGLARERVGAGPAQLINAVLRNLTEKPYDEWLELVMTAAPDEISALAVLRSHPVWITRALREALVANGRDAGEIEQLLAADNVAPLVTLVARPGLAEIPELMSSGTDRTEFSPGHLVGTALRIRGTDPGSFPAVREGRAGVQDEGSQAVTLAFAAAPVEPRSAAGDADGSATGPASSDHNWLDLCAGPGGKTALLGAIAAHRGAHLVANEVAPHRARLVEHAITALPPGTVEVRVGDGRDFAADHPQAFDRVLVDAPCTGLGALRRRPESRWRRTPADLATLTVLQRELLTAAAKATRVGGVVGYVTCSPHVAENQIVVDDVIRRLTKAHENGEPNSPVLERMDAVAALRSVLESSQGPPPDLGTGPDLQLWPHLHGTDAMHLTMLRRVA